MLEPIQESTQPLKPPTSSNGQIRYRSPSAAELIHSPGELDAKMKRARQESMGDKIHRFRSLILVVSIPILLVMLVIYVKPRGPAALSAPLSAQDHSIIGRKAGMGNLSKSYAVVFDAGSSGSRVHVYCFDGKLNLLPIGQEIEVFIQKKPGLSSYAKNPSEAADSLKSLLEEAESVIPTELRGKTHVRVGATAGLRQLGIGTSEQILEAVRNLLHDKSSLKFKSDWVSVLDGTQEGAFQWVTINYLLGNLGKKYSNTVGVVDLGGGSVQMAYAISESEAAKAPKPTSGEDEYVKELFLKGTKYYLYVHSYLLYGLLAARAEILKVAEGPYSDCILNSYQGSYKYGDKEFPVSSSPSGSSYTKCRSDSVKALKHDETTCTHLKCTFGGIWNGGGGDGQKKLFVASFFFDRAAEAGFVDANSAAAKVKPSDFEEAAKRVCKLSVEEAKATYPNVAEETLPYLCMDLVYQFTLLVDGFGLEPWQSITLVKRVKYGDSLVEAAWPLGSAIELASIV